MTDQHSSTSNGQMTIHEIEGIEHSITLDQLEPASFGYLPWEALSEVASTIIRLKKRHGIATSRDKFQQSFLCYARREKERRNGGGIVR